MAATVHFLYPHEPEGSTFNMEHYSKKHLPQAAELFSQAKTSFRSWEIIKYDEGQPYQLVTVLRFGDIQDFVNFDMTPLLSDVPNFTKVNPADITVVTGKSEAGTVDY